MPKNPFGDEPGEAADSPRRPNPFGEAPGEADLEDGSSDPASTIEHASARIRRLRSLVGAEGLTLSATRELLDQVTKALDAVARALRDRH